ncbi:MAG TPA: flagellar basal body P-ring formation chaperone FlgA [Thauera sp.]|nr:flagellar basal body P-ring formation chaperone FlgA [Thauera sp.]
MNLQLNPASQRRFKLVALLTVALAGLCAAAPLAAQQAPEPIEARVRDFLQNQAAGLPGEVSVTVGTLDPNNQLPACAAIEPFLPAGTRAWGRISVGVRCDSPVTWTAYLQAEVAVTADYLVAARPLRAGQIVGHADLSARRGNLAALPDNILTDPTQATGHKTRVAIAAGSPLRIDMLRVPHAVRQGQNVQVMSIGPGFKVASEGRALNNAAPGDSVRVRLASGQTVTGVAQADGTVELNF